MHTYSYARIKVLLSDGREVWKAVRYRLSGAQKYMAKLKHARRVLKGATQAEVQELARTHAIKAIRALAEIITAKDANATAKLGAASLLFERGYGKAAQTNINANVNTDGAPREITGDQLEQRIRETIERVEGISTRKRDKIVSEERPTDLRKLN